MILLFVAAAMATFSTHAQTDIKLDHEAMYFEIDDLPNAVKWLPEPPEPNSTQFSYDLTQYMWGKGERLNEERAQQAIDNGVVEMDDMAVQFSGPFGMEISKEKTPCIFRVLYRGVLTVRLCATKPKTTYARIRCLGFRGAEAYGKHTPVKHTEDAGGLLFRDLHAKRPAELYGHVVHLHHTVVDGLLGTFLVQALPFAPHILGKIIGELCGIWFGRFRQPFDGIGQVVNFKIHSLMVKLNVCLSMSAKSSHRSGYEQ